MNSASQLPRLKRILPDAQDAARLVLIKACSTLRLTLEIRTAAEVASRTGRSFVLVLTGEGRLQPPLEEFLRTANVAVVQNPSNA